MVQYYMIDEHKRLPAAFYQSGLGHEPVREWLKSLDAGDKKLIGKAIKRVEFGWPIGMPTCRPLGDGLFEIRVSLSSGRIARVIFCLHEKRMILLHGFIKKSQKLPEQELQLARRRRAEIKEHR